MANLLLLCDTKEKDLARDFQEMLEELNIGKIAMIPLAPDKGLTLDNKEKHYFDSSEGAIFLITPGSERFGSFFPSPSVSHEMGQAKQKFENKPECVIYLVDESCNMPAIDQKTYIPFVRSDIRSVISAMTHLIRNLKSASLFRVEPIPTQTQVSPKKINLNDFYKNLNPTIKKVLLEMSNRMNGFISDKDIKTLLGVNFGLLVQDINFLLRDLEYSKTVIHSVTGAPNYFNSWWLNDLGWSVVRLDVEAKKKLDKQTINTLASLLGQRKIK